MGVRLPGRRVNPPVLRQLRGIVEKLRMVRRQFSGTGPPGGEVETERLWTLRYARQHLAVVPGESPGEPAVGGKTGADRRPRRYRAGRGTARSPPARRRLLRPAALPPLHLPP